ncbi:hypothetical protein KGF56_000318 [Candida oxycetoniae]|uniref:Uncharacterized protein n=1 Tax=Candida oxycetoniae TaxID=497107 RepID=A0AAI9T1S2_9ASCO|nr:uncharacterized protein KGF56_000318 [Candida oxycetoniae]KAI3406857.1 hypothetical protein KGF56_000318 [Candida oxycetoniae]
MKFLQSVSLLALASQSLAALSQIQLFAKSENKEIDGKGLYYTHEGAGINYFFISTEESSPQLTYDDVSKEIYRQISPQIRFQFSKESDIVQLSVFSPETVEIKEDGLLTFTGSDTLYAAKNINDPYRYSENAYAVVVGDSFGGVPLEIVAKKV